MTKLDLRIRELQDSDVPILEKFMAFGARDKFQRLHKSQQSGATVFTAWLGDKPVGQILIEWEGASDPKVKAVVDCPNIKSLFVHPDLRQQGIAQSLMAEAHKSITDRGLHLVGLGVDLENHPALEMYAKLGYEDAGVDLLKNTHEYVDFDGQEWKYEQTARYLVKKL